MPSPSGSMGPGQQDPTRAGHEAAEGVREGRHPRRRQAACRRVSETLHGDRGVATAHGVLARKGAGLLGGAQRRKAQGCGMHTVPPQRPGPSRAPSAAQGPQPREAKERHQQDPQRGDPGRRRITPRRAGGALPGRLGREGRGRSRRPEATAPGGSRQATAKVRVRVKRRTAPRRTAASDLPARLRAGAPASASRGARWPRALGRGGPAPAPAEAGIGGATAGGGATACGLRASSGPPAGGVAATGAHDGASMPSGAAVGVGTGRTPAPAAAAGSRRAARATAAPAGRPGRTGGRGPADRRAARRPARRRPRAAWGLLDPAQDVLQEVVLSEKPGPPQRVDPIAPGPAEQQLGVRQGEGGLRVEKVASSGGRASPRPRGAARSAGARLPSVEGSAPYRGGGPDAPCSESRSRKVPRRFSTSATPRPAPAPSPSTRPALKPHRSWSWSATWIGRGPRWSQPTGSAPCRAAVGSQRWAGSSWARAISCSHRFGAPGDRSRGDIRKTTPPSSSSDRTAASRRSATFGR